MGNPVRIELCQPIQRSLFEDDFLTIKETWIVGKITGQPIVAIEALLQHAKLRLGSEMPFPDHGGVVTPGFELLCQSDFVRVQTEEPMRRAFRIDTHV